MDFDKTPRKLWEHPNPKSTPMYRFMQDANRQHGLNLQTFDDLYAWSCSSRAKFWEQVWQHNHHIHEGTYSQVVDESIPISQLPRWFEGVRLNYAENLLWTQGEDSPGSRSTRDKEDDKIALTEIREGNTEIRHVTWRELRESVAQLASALQNRGVKAGDRVVIVGAHSVSTLLVLLATTWLGALFSSSSTDMGVSGLLQRTVQIDPKFVFFDDGGLYNGKVNDLRDKIAGVVDGMKGCTNFEKAIIIQRFAKPYDTSRIDRTERIEEFLKFSSSTPPLIKRIGFQDPMIVYYSSGTTGIPKAIVHGVGPLLLNGKKDAIIHRSLTPTDVGLQFTTTGWIMYLSSVSQLSTGGRAVLYDGSPFAPDAKLLLRIAAEQKVTRLGISPRWMAELQKNEIVPRDEFDLSSLHSVVSTGMVLPEQMFEWFYDVAFPKKVQLCNISGGTDIAGCFVGENPLKPLYVGGCMGPSLGAPIAVFDHDAPEGSVGKPVPNGTPGDLVATAAFPNMPLYLWGDGDVSPGTKYRGAYFDRFKDVWAQGDFCAIHPKTGAMHMLGRSDGVLNPSGVRFGSSDIYNVLEKHFPKQIAESICVGQRRPQDSDERVVLFLIMKKGVALDKKLVAAIKNTIAEELSKRHVPKYIFEVPEIPTTVNGKKVELPVKSIVSGKTVKPSGTLLNPQSLDFFYRFQKIEELVEPQAKL